MITEELSHPVTESLIRLTIKGMELTQIYTAEDEIEAQLFKRALQRSGIHSKIEPDFSGPPVGGMFPVGGTMPHKHWRIWVQKNDYELARDVISKKVTPEGTRHKEKHPRWAVLMQTILNALSLAMVILGALGIVWSLLEKFLHP